MSGGFVRSVWCPSSSIISRNFETDDNPRRLPPSSEKDPRGVSNLKLSGAVRNR